MKTGAGRVSLAGINIRVCSCRVILSRPARRPVAGGEVTARTQGVGVPPKRVGLVVTAVRGCQMDRSALEMADMGAARDSCT